MALIGCHVVVIHLHRGVFHEGNRLGWIGDITIRTRRTGRPGSQAALVEEKQLLLAAIAGWPGVVAAPDIGAGLKNGRFCQVVLAFAFQVELKEWQLDLLAEVLGGFRIETGIPQAIASTTGPAAMIPRAHDQAVIPSRAEFFGGFVAGQGAVVIFRVEKAPHIQHGGLDILQVGRQIHRLPEFVVGTMLHHFVPEADGSFQVFLVGVGQGPHVEEELVAVGGLVIERHPAKSAGDFGAFLAKARHEIESVG